MPACVSHTVNRPGFAGGESHLKTYGKNCVEAKHGFLRGLLATGVSYASLRRDFRGSARSARVECAARSDRDPIHRRGGNPLRREIVHGHGRCSPKPRSPCCGPFCGSTMARPRTTRSLPCFGSWTRSRSRRCLAVSRPPSGRHSVVGAPSPLMARRCATPSRRASAMRRA